LTILVDMKIHDSRGVTLDEDKNSSRKALETSDPDFESSEFIFFNFDIH